MSYDLMIIADIDGFTVAHVAEGFERMDQGQPYPFGEPTEALENCANEIWKHFPPLSELNDDDIEQSIWSCDHSTVDGFLHMAMFLRVDQSTLNLITSIAHNHGFIVFDPQLDTFRTAVSGIQESSTIQSVTQRLIGLFAKKKDN